MIYRSVFTIVLAVGLWSQASVAQLVSTPGAEGRSSATSQSGDEGREAYILGPQDTVLIKVLNMDELGTLPYPIDLRGNLNIPAVGRIHAEGLTIEQLEDALTVHFREFLQEPVVTVTIAEFHSQPISVLGQVVVPGVRQIQGRKTLF